MLMHKKNKILLLMMVASTFSFAQPTESEIREFARTKSEQEIVTEASRMTQDGFIFSADILTDRLLEMNPLSANYNYRKGFMILNLTGNYVKAIPHFVLATTDIDPNYDMYSSKEKSSPTDAYYHLAQCYHYDENIDLAKENYQKFLDATKKKSELIPKAQLRIKQCELAKQLMASPVNVRLKNIGQTVNTNFPEYSPVVSLDGSALYFTSRRPWPNGETESFKDLAIDQYPEDVYVSFLAEDSNWMDPIMLNFCLPKRNEATMAVSTNERRIYLYEDSTGNGDIFYTDFYASKFNEITQLKGDKLNTDYWETHAMVSHDQSRIFFSSDRPGGFGGRDLYVSYRQADSSWSKPVNMGPRINTPNDEDSPFVSVDNRQLYYSSNGEKSMGGFDVMVCDLMADNTYSEGRNIGYPFNSTNDDIFYTTTVDGLKGYMTSYRKDGFGEKDIYEIYNDYLGVKSTAIFRGLIKTSDGSPLPEDFALNFKLMCDACDESEQYRSLFPRLRDGMFLTWIKPCQTYKIAYYNASDNQVMHEETFVTDCESDYQEIYRELVLDVPTRSIVIPKDTVLDIEPVLVTTHKNLEFIHYFDYNKNKLTVNKGDLKDFVKEIEAQLKDGRPRITINVYSSASHVPTKTYETNEKLTELRAENMKYDLQTHFEKNPDFAGKVNVVIVSAIVDGPEYEKDFKDKNKYKPYQFVGLKTE
jgi:tetratricopeptide (TPR) repeat protein